MRILIVDDHEPIRREVRSLLAGRPDLSLCGEAADGLEAIEMARQLRPDLILMDMSMPRMGGLEAIRLIRPELPQCEFIIVSQNDPALVREQAASVSVQYFIAKSDLPRDLLPAIDRISAAGSKTVQWPAGGGEMGAIMRSTDWSRMPLGSVESWSPALRMMVPFLLANRFPQLLWWGPHFCCLYNDAYIPVLGEKHPWALGRPTEEVWHEIWHVLSPLIETPFRGGPATWMEDLLVEINRKGFVEETHFTIAYSPVPDETAAGGIGGVLATVHEITAKVIGDRRVVILRDLGARSGEPKTVQEALTLASEILSRHTQDLPFVLFYLFDDKRQTAHLVSSAGIDLNDAGVLRTINLGSQDSSPSWPFSAALETEEIQFVLGLEDKFDCVPQGPWPDPPTSAAVVPVRSNIAHQLVGFIVVGVSARLQFDESYRNFLELLSTQISAMVANARAYEEERKRAEALAEIDRAKTAFFSNVSHEFRTPLTLMMGPLEDAIAESEGLSGSNRERLELAHRNSLRLLKLVNTLLDFSRIEAGRIQASYEPTDLAVLTAELASVFRSAIERAGMRLVIDCPGLPKNVYVDREMWEKIVLNLLSNAFKFTFEGEIAVSLRAVDSTVELSVRDTGTGIPPEEIPKLFERFHRVKGARGRSFEGSGIGLALVQELAKLHGGSVRVESHVNQGATFTVTIPLGKDHLPADRIGGARILASTGPRGDAYLQEALRWLSDRQGASDEVPAASLPSSTESVPASAQESEQRPRVLLADDNADMRDYAERLLAGQYEVTAVADGEAALKCAREHRPDLILSDIMMPGLDGFGLLRAVRAEESLKNVPVVLLSARAGEESRIEGLDAGADNYLVKPFSARELLARVKSHLAIARLRQESSEREHALRLDAERNELRFRAIVDATPECVKLVTREGALIHMNEAGLKMIEADNLEMVAGKSVYELIAPNDCERFREFNARVCAGHRGTLQFEIIGLQGTHRHLESHAVPLRQADGSFMHLAVTLDVTERRRGDRATALLAAIVDSSDDAIVSKNLDGVITSWNKGAERIFGYTAQEAIGKNITLIIPPERYDEETNILRRIRNGQRIDHFETIRMRKDGTLFDVSVTISPLKDASGRVIGASKVARDISERKSAMEALRQSEESFRALSEKLDSEVRERTQELVEKNADVLRQSQQLRELSWQLLHTQDEERRHIARELHDSAGQTLAVLGMMISSVVEMARHKIPEVADSAKDIHEVVQQLTKEIRTTSYLLHPPLLDENGLPPALSWYLRGLTERSGLDIAFHISEEFGRLSRDMELVVFRVVQECLTNVHRHSGSKSAAIRITRETDRVVVEVRDQGKGISPERLAEIQSKSSGVGIRGMRERLRQFQGEMIIQSGPAGTTVLVTIPLSAATDPVQSADSFESAV
ncbi:MAG: response regulator [Candidatus Acidiferrales bacterium]